MASQISRAHYKKSNPKKTIEFLLPAVEFFVLSNNGPPELCG